MGLYLLTVLMLCTLGAVVRGRAVVSPKKQAELVVSLMTILSVYYCQITAFINMPDVTVGEIGIGTPQEGNESIQA